MMLKWLLGLGLFLYAALMIAGDDNGQQRAGLRAQPAEAMQTVVVTPPPDDTPVTRAAMAELVPMMPAPPPIRILPPTPLPQERVAQEPAPSAEDATAEDALVQAMLAQPDDPLAMGDGQTLRWIAVQRANVRADARKSAPVTARLEQGEAVAVLWTDPSGWARVRIEGDGIDGYVHESLLTDLNPQFQ